MKQFIKTSIFVSAVILTLTSASAQNNTLPSWAFGGFVRPDPTSTFNCPMRKTPIGWEEAIRSIRQSVAVKDGKIFELYHAVDNSAVGIDKQTSRIHLFVYENEEVNF